MTVTDSCGTTENTYDDPGILTAVTNPDGTTIAYAYDAEGNRTSVTTPSGTAS